MKTGFDTGLTRDIYGIFTGHLREIYGISCMMALAGQPANATFTPNLYSEKELVSAVNTVFP